MVIWLSIAALGLVLGLIGLGVLYSRYKQGLVERSDVGGGTLLILLTLGLVAISELFVRELVGIVFFVWLPFWLIWRRRGPRERA